MFTACEFCLRDWFSLEESSFGNDKTKFGNF